MAQEESEKNLSSSTVSSQNLIPSTKVTGLLATAIRLKEMRLTPEEKFHNTFASPESTQKAPDQEPVEPKAAEAPELEPVEPKPAEVPTVAKEVPEPAALPNEPAALPETAPVVTEEVSLDSFNTEASQEEIRSQLQMDKLALEMEKKELKQLQQKKLQEEEAKKEARKANKIKSPIGVKLITIISVLVVLALGSVTLFVSYFTTQDVRTNAEENNLVINSRTASACEGNINRAVSSVGMFLDLLQATGGDEAERFYIEKLFFDRNPEIVAVYFPQKSLLFKNEAFLVSNEIKEQAVHDYITQEESGIVLAEGGAFELLNASPYFSVPLLALFCPILLNGESTMAALLYSTASMNEDFSAGSINQSFFVNNDGAVLVHGDVSLMMQGADEKDSSIVKFMQQSVLGNGQTSYSEDGEEYIGAFRKLSIGNGAVITVVKTAVILEGVKATTRRNILITVVVLSLTIMIIYFFSKTLSTPLKKLTAVANEINKGNFNTELFNTLTTKNQDEIGLLTKSTKNEREILNTFTRLTNKGVTKAIITKAIDFEPHLKDITIFFSDIRGFTAISDGFKNRFGEKSAAEIIGFLNDYMSRMVTCITRTGGIIDKFEGDAIMACWGVLRNDSLDWETRGISSVTRALKQDAHDRYVKADALGAVKSCIAMRYSLMKYNKDAAEFTEKHKNDLKATYKPHIRIGAGLNSGRATVGFMGSFEKMEFTSIGDAVNLASRTEASNKPCGTDILLTEDTLALLKNDYIRCTENDFKLTPEHENDEIIVEQIPVEFEVKGKGKQHFYGVVNMPKFNIQDFFGETDPTFEVDPDCEKVVGPKGPKTLNEMRNLLGIPIPDFAKVNLDAEENKIQVASA